MISIIGAGPIGNYLAYLLSKEGKEVSVFEEHKKVGEPVRCTGLTTDYLNKVIDVDDQFVVNKLNKIMVFSKNEKVEIKLNEIVLDRSKLDTYWYRKAKKQGANFYLGYRFLDYKKHLRFREENKIRKMDTDILVGADGPLSKIYWLVNNSKRDYFNAMQLTLDLENCGKSFETYFGSICPGFFAWVVPESRKRVRIGLAMKGNPKKYFNKFLQFRVGNDYRNKIISVQHGLIPFYSRINVQRKNIFLVGDAANHVKATTGGGLIPGFKAANSLCYSIVSERSYSSSLNRLSLELELSLKIRRVLNRFSDSDYNYLLKLMKEKKVKDVLNLYSRDEVFSLIWRLLLKEPRFLKFFRKLI